MFEANLLGYAAAAALVMVTPGPANILIMARGASSSRAGAIALVGLLTANLMLLGAVIFGIASLLLASQPAFIAMKWIGAAYLLYLGVQFIRKAGHVSESAPSPERGMLDGFLTGISNPKALVFYFAFLPQFLTDHAPAHWQLIGLGTVDLVLAAVIFGAYALAGSSMMRFMHRAGVRAWIDRCAGGVMMVSAGMILRTVQPAT
jgi:homoserine/homoserine lactone efflux protein